MWLSRASPHLLVRSTECACTERRQSLSGVAAYRVAKVSERARFLSPSFKRHRAGFTHIGHVVGARGRRDGRRLDAGSSELLLDLTAKATRSGGSSGSWAPTRDRCTGSLKRDVPSTSSSWPLAGRERPYRRGWYFGDELGLLRALALNPPDLTVASSSSGRPSSPSSSWFSRRLFTSRVCRDGGPLLAVPFIASITSVEYAVVVLSLANMCLQRCSFGAPGRSPGVPVRHDPFLGVGTLAVIAGTWISPRSRPNPFSGHRPRDRLYYGATSPILSLSWRGRPPGGRSPDGIGRRCVCSEPPVPPVP